MTNTPLLLRQCSCIFPALSPLRQDPCSPLVVYDLTRPQLLNLLLVTMSQVRSIILADNRPADLPLPKNIVRLCRDAGYDLRGIPIIGESCGVTSAWVKYGRSVTMGEALTQDWVGKVVNASPDAAVRIPKVYHAFEHGAFGYIVMEYIDGPECDVSDAPQVGAAVECLIRIKGPITAPGPVGRGPITHRFFVEVEVFRYCNTLFAHRLADSGQ